MALKRHNYSTHKQHSFVCGEMSLSKTPSLRNLKKTSLLRKIESFSFPAKPAQTKKTFECGFQSITLFDPYQSFHFADLLSSCIQFISRSLLGWGCLLHERRKILLKHISLKCDYRIKIRKPYDEFTNRQHMNEIYYNYEKSSFRNTQWLEVLW